MQTPTHILVIRFSAMGDVAMTVPVIRNILHQHPQVHITFVSNAFFAPMFEGLERCEFHPAHLKEKHKGAAGMFTLFKELKKKHRFSAVADLHSVLRSSLLTAFFKMAGYKTATIDKGRKEKKALTRRFEKDLHQLEPMHLRYAKVLQQLGFDTTQTSDQPVYLRRQLPSTLQSIFSEGKKMIGVAPFAQHSGKMYPVEKMKMVVQQLSANYSILLFGGGNEEAAVLQNWQGEMKNVQNVAGKFSFSEELAIISNLDIMLSMDSANMHLASLFKVPVVSIWGATHPFAGFYGWGQDTANIVQVDLECRPCSVFGNKPCFRGDHACMNLITEMQVIEKVNQLLTS